MGEDKNSLNQKTRIMKSEEILGTDGGYIIGPTHAIPGDTPPENIVALQKTTDVLGLRVETCWEQSL